MCARTSPKGEKVNQLRSYSSLAKGVENEAENMWRGYIFAPQDEVDTVKKICLGYLADQGPPIQPLNESQRSIFGNPNSLDRLQFFFLGGSASHEVLE